MPNTLGNPRTTFVFFENLTLETPEPRSHLRETAPFKCFLNIVLDILWIERWHITTETRANTFRTIHENHGKCWHVKVWFNGTSVIVQIVENWIVARIKDFSGILCELCEDIPRLRRILTTHETSTKLTTRFKKINVI